MNIKKEIQILETNLQVTLGSLQTYTSLIREIQKVKGTSISKKKMIELLGSLQRRTLEGKIKTEGALEFARKLSLGGSPKRDSSPQFDLEEESEEEYEESEPIDEEDLDPSVRQMFGLDEEEDEEGELE